MTSKLYSENLEGLKPKVQLKEPTETYKKNGHRELGQNNLTDWPTSLKFIQFKLNRVSAQSVLFINRCIH